MTKQTKLSPQLRYYYENKEACQKRKRAWYLKNRKSCLLKRKEYSEKVRQLKVKLFGDRCKLCNRKARLVIHEIRGYPHKNLNSIPILLNLNVDDYIALCYKCHNVLHAIQRNKSMELLIKLIRGLS